ncbi:hypothetical protein GCM10027591_03740 [Zhihengliuella somnathii]
MDGEIVGDEYTFTDFWNTYPRRVAKGAALKAWEKATANGGVDPAVIVQGAQRYANDPNREPAYTKHPATWLNAQCWEDDPIPRKLSTAEEKMRRAYEAMAGYELMNDQDPFRQPAFGQPQNPFELEPPEEESA